MALIKKGYSSLLDSYGTLVRDRYGVDSATARWWNNDKSTAPSLPAAGASHPLWSYMTLDKVQCSDESDHWSIEASYAGIYGSPTPIYDLDLSTSEEPIDSHPDFITTLGGTVAAPLNGAVFDATGIFQAFTATGWIGIKGYLAPGAVWRQTSVSSGAPSDISTVGHITTPLGSPPTVESGRTWLYTGLSYEKRGGAYTIRKEWRLSSLRGWEPTIYT